VFPCLSCASIAAPRRTRARTNVSCPPSAAKWSGVRPRGSVDSMLCPSSSSSMVRLSLPRSAARRRASTRSSPERGGGGDVDLQPPKTRVRQPTAMMANRFGTAISLPFFHDGLNTGGAAPVSRMLLDYAPTCTPLPPLSRRLRIRHFGRVRVCSQPGFSKSVSLQRGTLQVHDLAVVTADHPETPTPAPPR
jgi:hypothetical protein